MRSGLWPRRLSRWRTRKSLPTDGAGLRATSATARDVSRAFVLASACRGGAGGARRGSGRRYQAAGRRRPPLRAVRAPRCPRRGPPLCSPGDQNSARMDAKSGHRGCKVSGSGWGDECERQLADRGRDLPRTLCTRRHFVHQVTRKRARTAQKVVISCAKSTEAAAVTHGNRTEAGDSLDFVDSTTLCRRRDQNLGLERPKSGHHVYKANGGGCCG
jgi:hypothetical protein